MLALNFASVVPREEVEKWGADFGKHPVGSGAFELQEWKLGQELIFRKNPNYFKAGVPRLDHIKFEMGQDPRSLCCGWKRRSGYCRRRRTARTVSVV